MTKENAELLLRHESHKDLFLKEFDLGGINFKVDVKHR